MKITHFERVKLQPDQYAKHTREIDLQEFLEAVKAPPDDLAQKIHAIRSEQDAAKRGAIKDTLPAVSISANFPDKRHAKSAHTVTSLIQIDIDKVNDPEQLKTQICADPHTLACFISPSGNGVKAIVRTDASAKVDGAQLDKLNEHKSIYAIAQRYYKQHFNVQIDTQCSDISRVMYYSYDPEIYINLDATPLQELQELQELKSKSKPKAKRIPKKVLDIVEQIESSGMSLSYDDRFKMGMSFVNEYGEQGRELFHRISRNHENYNAEKFDAKLNDFLESSRGEISLGSFFHIAKEHGFIPDKNADLIKAVQELKIRYNEVTNEYEIPVQESLYPDDKRTIFEPLRDKMENTIYVRLKSEGHDINIHELRTHIHSDYGSISYNPFTDYLDTLRHLQDPSTPALNQVLSALPVKDARILLFVRKWLVSIISAMHGKPSDLLLVFCGGQGTGKTVFFETLLPLVLRKYYAESAHEGSKDDLLLMCRSLLLLDDEYHGRSKRESEKIKAILSQKEFTIRASYARNHETRKRYAVFCGTSNISEIKFDITGNRRIIPVELTGMINRELYTSKIYSEHDSPSRDHLFADLLYLYNQDPNQWRINGNDAKVLNEITAENEAHSIEQDLIDMCFLPCGSDGEKWHSIAQIIRHIEYHSEMRVDAPMRNRFSLILRKMGYTKTKRREANAKRTESAVWGYEIAPRHTENY